MCVLFLHTDCLYTDPVDPKRECLPSPEQLKGKILVKVRTYVRRYIQYIKLYLLMVGVVHASALLCCG